MTYPERPYPRRRFRRRRRKQRNVYAEAFGFLIAILAAFALVAALAVTQQ